MLRILLLTLLLLPDLASAFGSATILGMRNEHARITQAALSCSSKYDEINKPTPCFEPKTMSNLGGESPGAFPAVESPDNIALHFSGGPDWWHCDNADYVPDASYSQTRKQASDNLLSCRKWAEILLKDGLKKGDSHYDLCTNTGAKDFRCTGVGSLSRLLLNTNNQVDISQPDYFSLTSGCSFNGSSGRIKCEVLQQFGYALHVVQDFYSHSNYADYTDLFPYNWRNPVGLLSSSTPELWDFRKDYSSLPLPNEALSTGCYPDDNCYIYNQRTPHLLLNKDKAMIDPLTGNVTDPRGFRGGITFNGIPNEKRAVDMAIRQTRAAWMDLQAIIIKKEGQERGRKIICAIASDNPNRDCNRPQASSASDVAFSSYSPTMEPDPTKIEPYPWMMDHYNFESESSNNLTYVSNTQNNEAGHYAGINSTKTLACGDKTIFKRWGMPDDNTTLTAYDMHVAGVSCSNAIQLLRKYKQFYSADNTNGRRYSVPEIQCVVIPEQDDLIPGLDEDPSARLVCKNKDETKEISFHPDCSQGAEQGHCGL